MGRTSYRRRQITEGKHAESPIKTVISPAPASAPHEVWHMRCPLCGMQSRLSENYPMRPNKKRPIPRIADGPYQPEVTMQIIGGSLPAAGGYPGSQGFSEWKDPQELSPDQLEFLRRQLRAACKLVGGIL